VGQGCNAALVFRMASSCAVLWPGTHAARLLQQYAERQLQPPAQRAVARALQTTCWMPLWAMEPALQGLLSLYGARLAAAMLATAFRCAFVQLCKASVQHTKAPQMPVIKLAHKISLCLAASLRHAAAS
jgi:hypothetical protein